MPILILAQLAPKCGTIRPESLAQLAPKWVAQLAPDYPGDANRNWLATQGSELAKQIESIHHFFKTGEIKDK